ncbi:DUF5994 family protein [Mycolicibacterium sp. CBM1]
MRSARRTASPVRLTLNSMLGGDIDGAWWPHTGSLAAELPELIDSLHAQLGEIVDINLNWSPTMGAPILQTHSSAAVRDLRWNDSRQRIMVVVGKVACARLLVIPHLTSPALARMVLRCAAAMAVPADERDKPEFTAAERVMRAAEAQSASSAARALATPADSAKS